MMAVNRHARESRETGDGRHLVCLRVSCSFKGDYVRVIAGEPDVLLELCEERATNDLAGLGWERPEEWTSDNLPSFRWVRRDRFPHHLLYALYPVGVVVDVITFPIQALIFLTEGGTRAL